MPKLIKASETLIRHCPRCNHRYVFMVNISLDGGLTAGALLSPLTERIGRANFEADFSNHIARCLGERR